MNKPKPIAIDLIRIDAKTQFRAAINQDRVTDYAEQLDVVSCRDLSNNKRNRERLAILERRHDYLADRCEANPSLTFDAAECAALFWAVRVLRKTIGDEPQ